MRGSDDIRAYMKAQLAMAGRATANTPDPNVRWGKRASLQYKAGSGVFSAAMVSSAMYKENIVFAFGMRFGDPLRPEAPLRPYIAPFTFSGAEDLNIAGVRFTITRSIDAKTGPVVDTVDLTEGEAMPACELLARQITIAVTIIPIDPTQDTRPWVIEVTAAPVDSINCDSLTEVAGWEHVIVPPPIDDLSSIQGYRTLTSFAVGGDVPSKLLNANPRRSQFSIMNVGPIPVAIGFGPSIVSLAPGVPLFPSWGTVALGNFPYATLILAGITDFTKEFARYESPLDGFTGEVWGVAQTGKTPLGGVVCITEGEKPVL